MITKKEFAEQYGISITQQNNLRHKHKIRLHHESPDGFGPVVAYWTRQSIAELFHAEGLFEHDGYLCKKIHKINNEGENEKNDNQKNHNKKNSAQGARKKS